MKKTNIRLNNHFIIENNKKYFLSDIDDLESWKSIKNKDLKKSSKDDITQILNDLLKKHNLKSNVNFIHEHKKEIESPIKVIKLNGGKS